MAPQRRGKTFTAKSTTVTSPIPVKRTTRSASKKVAQVAQSPRKPAVKPAMKATAKRTTKTTATSTTKPTTPGPKDVQARPSSPHAAHDSGSLPTSTFPVPTRSPGELLAALGDSPSPPPADLQQYMSTNGTSSSSGSSKSESLSKSSSPPARRSPGTLERQRLAREAPRTSRIVQLPNGGRGIILRREIMLGRIRLQRRLMMVMPPGV